MAKFVNAEEAISQINDGDVVVTSGFVGSAVPEELEIALEKHYLRTQTPKGLTLVYSCGQGDADSRGLNHLGYPGLFKRIIGGHWNLAPKLQKLVMDNVVEAYNLPQGTMSQMYREIAAHRPGVITKVGLKTFVDPRVEGGKLNDCTTEDIVKVIEIMGEEYLLYKSFPMDIALVRGSYADENGNVTMHKETAYLDVLPICQAVYNSGGKVIVQVEQVVSSGSLNAKDVQIPGIYVDSIVVASDCKNHMMTFAEQFNPAYAGDIRVPVDEVKPMPLCDRKVICRRCAVELTPDAVVNLGIGIPEGVAIVANEEKITNMTLTVESGQVGGIPAGGLSFGATLNAQAIINQPSQFDFYDGGGIDVAFLGLAQCDAKGNINVSKFGSRIAGAGGFIDISQNSKKVVFCGTFTTGGLEIKIEEGKIKILKEGKIKKFISKVEQITYSSDYANEIKQEVLYITERAVFKLTNNGLELVEIAPGVDLEKDIFALMDFKPKVSKNIKLMDDRIFKPELMMLHF